MEKSQRRYSDGHRQNDDDNSDTRSGGVGKRRENSKKKLFVVYSMNVVCIKHEK